MVRLHSGDPSIFGSIVEQIADLKAEGIDVEIVPGVSSMFAAAAASEDPADAERRLGHAPRHQASGRHTRIG